MPLHIFLAPILFGAAIFPFGYALDWLAMSLGALGWVIALALRIPAGMMLKTTGLRKETMVVVMILLSGPAEEILRLVGITFIAHNFAPVYSFGLGWAAIKVCYSAVSGLLTLSMLKRTDAAALEAQTKMKDMGLLDASVSPLWGLAERLSVSAAHIGFGFWLAWFEALVIPAIIVHSAMNLAAYAMMTKGHGVPRTQMVLFAVGAAVLALGLAVSF
jgi:hypothetical protein